MVRRLWHRLKFEIEGFLVRGPLHRLLVIALLIGLISLAGGALVFYGATQFADGPDAIWWAFLRLTDPGYLGDDEGTFVRTVSTVITVLGYVVFLGALVAIMTQWLNQTLGRLQSGLTPIAEANHIVILGWNNRITTIVHELLLSEERLKRFLRAHHEGSLRVAILAEQVTPELVQELRDQLGDLYDARQIILRSGTPLRIEHLRRVDYAHAAAILLPRPEGGPRLSDPDERTLKVLLSMSAAEDTQSDLPLLVAEISDARKLAIARRAYGGPVELIAADRMFARLIVQTLRNPGLSEVFGELLTHRKGTEIYVREAPAEFVGKSWGDVVSSYQDTAAIGIVRPGQPSRAMLHPPKEHPIERGDRIAVIAASWAAAAPRRSRRDQDQDPGAPARLPSGREVGRVLIIGWNEKVPAVLTELASVRSSGTAVASVDVVSRRPPEERSSRLRHAGVDLGSLSVTQIEMPDFAPHDLERLRPYEYDHVVIMASDRFEEEDETDARTIVSTLILDESCGSNERPHVVIEILDPDNEPLLRAPHREILVSPLLMGHVMAQVALRPELSAVFDELFGPGAAGFEFHSMEALGIAEGTYSQGELAREVSRRGGVLLGWRNDSGLNLNPPSAERVLLRGTDLLVVLRA